VRWIALVPLKSGAERKSRLAPRFSPAERAALSDRMARHVVDVLSQVERIKRTLLLSDRPLPALGTGWQPDPGQGLNPALETARAALGLPLLVLHADLPLIEAEDIAALLDAAEASGAAIAPDRHGSGTNAVALAHAIPFRFVFGADSFRRHLALAGPAGTAVARWRLSLDVDTPDDLDAACARGFSADV